MLPLVSKVGRSTLPKNLKIPTMFHPLAHNWLPLFSLPFIRDSYIPLFPLLRRSGKMEHH